MQTRYYRDTDNEMIAGVCAGLADAFNIDPTLVRLGFLIGLFTLHSAAVLIYIGLWLVMPDGADLDRELS